MNIPSLVILCLGLASLFIELENIRSPFIPVITTVLDLSILGIFFLNLLSGYLKAPLKSLFLKKNLLDIVLLLAILALFVYNRYIALLMSMQRLNTLSKNIVLLRNLLIVLKIFSRMKKINIFFRAIARKPAQTVTLGFISVILAGTVLLMMPFSTADGSHLGFINSLFTATSAVCVTGLIVVDTATRFSVYGRIIIMVLIQIGGLGIMILSLFISFFLGRALSLEEKMTAAYLLDRKEIKNLSHSVRNIILISFGLELAGALLLFSVFRENSGISGNAVLFSCFHAVSAFCNAGFALFTNSLEPFRSHILFNLTIMTLIILGGISFNVIVNLTTFLHGYLRKRIRGQTVQFNKITVNTKAVLFITFFLIVSGMLFFYGLEHKHVLFRYDLKTQYLSALFQSVTLRTAGFNTLNIAALQIPTLLIMILFMFIGGASGSTAGGIKVNTLSIIWAYVRAMFKGNREITLFRHSLSRDLVNRSFLIVILAIGVVFGGTLILSMTENFELLKLLFETVSAFGTVGLSTGITPDLTFSGKLIIIILMLIGRIGPLTLLGALARGEKTYSVHYPEANISIG